MLKCCFCHRIATLAPKDSVPERGVDTPRRVLLQARDRIGRLWAWWRYFSPARGDNSVEISAEMRPSSQICEDVIWFAKKQAPRVMLNSVDEKATEP